MSEVGEEAKPRDTAADEAGDRGAKAEEERAGGEAAPQGGETPGEAGPEEEPSTETEEGEEEEPRKRIIIVDSKEKSLDRAISILRKGGYSVVGVESREEFLEVMRGGQARERAGDRSVTPEEYWRLQTGELPDLIITDLDLRDYDGWEFIFDLKFDNRYYEYREVPIIVRTEEPITADTVGRVQSESIHDYLPKSMDGKELQKKIDGYFETRAKLAKVKEDITDVLGARVAEEYERITLAARIRLKYIHALQTRVDALKEEGAAADEIKRLEQSLFLQRREAIKYERRRREIKKKLKEKKDDGSRGSDEGGEGEEAQAR